MCWEVAGATGNVKYDHSSLWTSPSSILVTGVLLKASEVVLIFVTVTEVVADCCVHKKFL